MSQFADFQLADPLPEVLAEIGFEQPTAVQAKSIPLVLEGRDLLATAQTGTGKTAAFALPLISKMLRGWNRSVLIVTPTRELAEQIGGVLTQLTQKTPQLRTAVVIGGSSYPRQIRALQNQPAFVVGTPGRLIDQGRLGHLKVAEFGALVIDEADRLLDMGFEPQMNELIEHLPEDRQSLLFSATLPEEIMSLASRYLKNPVRVAVGAVSKPIEKIRQDMIRTTTSEKDQLLLREIDKVSGSVIVFVKTKYKTERLAKFLDQSGHAVTRIHGDRTQQQRSHAIAEFRSGAARILVATDIAARGLDIAHIEHVVNYDLPMAPEDYIHRIGRTARAGAEGHSIAFVTPEENMRWAQIYKLIYGRYPDEYPRRGGGMSGPRGKNSKFQHGKNSENPKNSGRRSVRPLDNPADRFRGKGSPGGKATKPAKAATQAISPRRQAELMAENFLKKERREQLTRSQPKRTSAR